MMAVKIAEFRVEPTYMRVMVFQPRFDMGNLSVKITEANQEMTPDVVRNLISALQQALRAIEMVEGENGSK
jgi:hypothetical protein